MFSGFPLLLLSVILSTLVLDPGQAAGRVQEVLTEYVPAGSDLVERGISGAVQAGGATLGVSVLALLWSGTRVFAHLTRALNDAWGVEHNYAIRTRILLEPLMVGLTVALIAAGILYDHLATRLWARLTGSPALPESGIWDLLGEGAIKLLGLLIVLAMYRYLPRRRVGWHDALPGAVLAVVLFQLVQEGFELYVQRYDERYSEVYGPLSSIAVVLLWAYVSAAIFLFGAEFSAAYRNLRTWRCTPDAA